MGARAVLTILRNGETLKSHPIEGEVMLGRADDCVIRLDDRAISRQHALFRSTPEGMQVEKKSEFAPLSVNGAECTRAVLREGDVISIGPYLMRVSIPRDPTPMVDPAPVAAMPPPAPAAGGTAVGDAPSLPSLGDPAMPEGEAPGNAGAPAEGEAAPGDFPPPEGEAPAEGIALEGADGAVAEVAPIEMASPEPTSADLGPVDEDAATRILSAGKVNVRLVFAPGAANVTDFELTKDEISIGRGKNCDIVLNDKKSSRKHAIIRRSGLQFLVKDLGSANGTLVNGIKVSEQALAGDDVVTVGDVEFRFVATSNEYEARQADFMPVPAEEPDAAPELDQLPAPYDAAAGLGEAGVPALIPGPDAQGLMNPAAGGLDLGGGAATAGAPDMAGIPGITGIPGAGSKKQSLLEKFKALPPRKQIIYGAVAFCILYWAFVEEDEPVKKGPPKKPTAQASTLPGPSTFETLSAEQKASVEGWHELAFRHFTNRDYDQCLFEIRKIFALIPDYKDSREIERYALEGKRKVEALQEEKRKREEEEQLKARIQQLVDETRGLMAKKDYPKAQEKFGDILAIDPENKEVGGWRKEIEEIEEQKRLAAQQKQVQVEINKRAWELYNEAAAVKKAGRCHEAIDLFSKVGDVGPSDMRPVKKAKAGTQACYAYIRGRRDPLLAEAKRLEQAGEFAPAFQTYKKATKVDPPHPAGYAGMTRIRGILQERSKVIYTEAVLAESYSDFATAKQKYQEVLAASPEDSLYYQRAQRKLSHYFGKKDGEPPQ